MLTFTLALNTSAQQTTSVPQATPSPTAPTTSITEAGDMSAATIVSVAPPESDDTADSDDSSSVNPNEQRLNYARALAAIGNYAGAVQTLDALRSASDSDMAIANVARMLLAQIYIEQADYKRATTLLGEAYNQRSAGGENGTRTYYTTAGQLLNSVRARLAHYRVYNVDITNRNLPVEVKNDLEGIRLMLEALIEQSRDLQVEAAKSTASNTDASALFENVVGVRLEVARDAGERDEWQRQLAEARQRLVAADARWQNVKSNVAQRPTTNAASRVANTSATSAASNSMNVNTSNSNTTPTSMRAAAEDVPAVKTQPAVQQADTASSKTNSASDTTIEVGALTSKATQRVQPNYPPTARNARVTGVVTVILVVNEQGFVETARSTSGPELLRRAAEDAARRWRFRQTLVGDQPVRFSGYLSFNFTL